MDFQSHPKMGTISFQLGDEVMAVHVERERDTARITIADRAYDVSVIHSRAGEVTFTVNGTTYTAFLASVGSTQYVAVDGEGFELKRPAPRRARRRQHYGESALTASMPGQITRVLVSAGDRVQRSQPLVVLEAMKMEIKIASPQEGRIVRVLVQQGQVVDRGQVLIEMGADP